MHRVTVESRKASRRVSTTLKAVAGLWQANLEIKMHHPGAAYEKRAITAFSLSTDRLVLAWVQGADGQRGDWPRWSGQSSWWVRVRGRRARIATMGHFIRHPRLAPRWKLGRPVQAVQVDSSSEALAAFISVSPR
jgi:hypothetical protein